MIDIRVDSKDGYKFILKAEAGNVLFESIGFTNENEVKQEVRTLSNIQHRRSVFERKTNHEGNFLFHLRNLKGKIIGSSMTYSSEAGMENGIKNLKKRIKYLSEQNKL